jgi:hypothetical protein
MAIIKGLGLGALFPTFLLSVQNAVAEKPVSHCRRPCSNMQKLVIPGVLQAKIKPVTGLKLEVLHWVRSSACSSSLYRKWQRPG